MSLTALALLLLLAMSSATTAAEIRLRGSCTAGGPVVKLGDVAEVVAGEPSQAERLAAVELFPAPPSGQQRFLRVRELQDLLLLRGVNISEHSISGSSQTTVASELRPARSAPPQGVSFSMSRRAHQRVCEAVIKYIEGQFVSMAPTAGDDRPRWVVEAELSESQARVAADPARSISVGGGHSPWTGAQRFQITVHSAEGPASFPLEARVRASSAVVVASHALQRGEVVRAEDLELRHDRSEEATHEVVQALEDAIGRETTRALAAGKPIPAKALRAPLLVRKGEIVAVQALSSGIRVSTMARARDDGSQGDLVAVESLLDRSAFFARVSGLRAVEVYARSPRVEPPRTARRENNQER